MPIATNLVHPHDPTISGNLIVWNDTRNGNSDIYLCEYNPETGLCPEYPITRHPVGQYRPDISGRRVVWADRRNGNVDVYTKFFNRAPEFEPIDDIVAYVGSYTYIMLSDYVHDPDGDRLTYSIENRPPGDDVHFWPTFGWFFWNNLSEEDIGTYEVTFTATDEYGLSDSQTVTIEVKHPGKPPDDQPDVRKHK